MPSGLSLSFDLDNFEKDCQTLAKGFASVPPAIAKRSIRAAIRRGVKPFVPELRKATPIRRQKRKPVAAEPGQKPKSDPGRPGVLRRNITTVTKFYNKSRYTSFVAKVSFAYGPGKANHFHLVEAGTAMRTAPNGANRGRVVPRRFLLETFNRMAPSISHIIQQELWVGLESAFRQVPAYLAARSRRRG